MSLDCQRAYLSSVSTVHVYPACHAAFACMQCLLYICWKYVLHRAEHSGWLCRPCLLRLWAEHGGLWGPSGRAVGQQCLPQPSQGQARACHSDFFILYFDLCDLHPLISSQVFPTRSLCHLMTQPYPSTLELLMRRLVCKTPEQ